MSVVAEQVHKQKTAGLIWVPGDLLFLVTAGETLVPGNHVGEKLEPGVHVDLKLVCGDFLTTSQVMI